jgi:hypothetical protein
MSTAFGSLYDATKQALGWNNYTRIFATTVLIGSSKCGSLRGMALCEGVGGTGGMRKYTVAIKVRTRSERRGANSFFVNYPGMHTGLLTAPILETAGTG